MQFTNNDFQDIMLHRHSVRHFDPSVTIPRSELQQMVQEAITAPSSCNLQAWHFVVVDTPEGKDKLRSFFMKFNFPQLDSCSAMIMIFGDTDAFKKYRALWQKMYTEHQITKERLDEILQTFLPLYEHADKQFLTADALIDSSLAAMQLLLTIRAHGYEANPLGGYDANKAATTLELDPNRYVPALGIAVGKPDPTAHEITSERYAVQDVLEFQ